MAPPSKTRATGVSVGSFLDLKAEVSKQESEWVKNRAAGKDKYIVGGIKRPDKKPTVWGRQNKGVASRSARDFELEAIERPVLEVAKAALERKAKIYEKLRKGKTGGLNEKQYDALLVDFDTKAMEEDHYSSDSDDVDESLTVPKPLDAENDPMVEYEDEFGRVRTARKSEVPREYVKSTEAEEARDDDPYVIYNPVNHFPVFEPSDERKEAIATAASEEANPLETHYDASREVRAKGAAFYQFSADEEKRKQEMEELRTAREATSRTRQETGAVDILPGEVEGLTMPEGTEEQLAEKAKTEAGVRSRAMEKRKREIEERRKLLDAKRRKVKGGDHDEPTSAEAFVPSSTSSTREQVEPLQPPPPRTALFQDPFAALESKVNPTVDPFTVLESKVAPIVDLSRRQPDVRQAPSPRRNAADEFLANIERDMLVKGR